MFLNILLLVVILLSRGRKFREIPETLFSRPNAAAAPFLAISQKN
jgi:hypothetical protein